MLGPESSVAERLAHLVTVHENGNKAAFARAVGISAQGAGDLLKGEKGGPSFPVLQHILMHYAAVREEWLLFGKGPIYRESDSIGEASTVNEPAALSMIYSKGGKPLPITPKPIGVPMVTVDSQNRENISLVSSKAAASYLTRYLEPEFYRDLPAFSIPLPQFQGYTFRAFEVVGDSMSPTLYSGGWVLARYVDFSRETLQEGYIHVVVTHEALVVKRVLDRIQKRGTLVLQSDNEEFQTYEVRIEDVQEVWRVAADIGFKFPNVRFDTRRRVAGMEADLQNVMARLEKIEKQRIDQE